MTSPTRSTMPTRIAVWRTQWGPITPLLLAEFVVWLGFGGLLPVLPIYFTEQGVDLATLGLVIAAWPAARLISEPVFGWIADRAPRVPMMAIGLAATGVFGALPLVLTTPLAFILLRAGAGLAAACYDPAARGYLTDATPPGKRGEAFGLYGAAQMGGLLIGPAIGAIGAAQFGGIGFVFVFSAIAAIAAAALIAARVHETPARVHEAPVRTHPTPPPPDVTEFPPDSALLARRAADDIDADLARAGGAPPSTIPTSLWNRGLIAAIVINAGGYYAGGTYEVIWSLFLEHLGADLAFVGLTFAMFGLPVLVLSPVAGRQVDRRGPFTFIVFGSIVPVLCGLAYTRLTTPEPSVLLILAEGAGFAFLNPALYAVVAANSPIGRSSTAQGIFGAAGTLGFIVASLGAGVLAAQDIVLPFFVFAAVLSASLVIGLLIGGRALRIRPAVSAGPGVSGS